jgi:hypothetical protein
MDLTIQGKQRPGAVRDVRRVTYESYEGSSTGPGSLIRITCNNGSDNVGRLQTAVLRLTGKVTQGDGISNLDTLHPVNAFAMHAFSEASLYIGNTLFETTRWLPWAVLMNAHFLETLGSSRVLNASVFGDGNRDKQLTDGRFELFIPLRLIFNYCNYQDNIYYAKIEVVLQRTANDAGIVQRINKKKEDGTETVSSETVKLTLDKVQLIIDHVVLDPQVAARVLSAVGRNVLQPVFYEKLNLYYFDRLTQSDKQLLPVRTYNFTECPDYVIVGFLGTNPGEITADGSTLVHNNCTGVRCYVNSVTFPSEALPIRRQKGEINSLYEEYLKAAAWLTAASRNELTEPEDVVSAPQALEPPLSRDAFNARFQVFSVRVNKKLIPSIASAVDVSVEISSEGASGTFAQGSVCLVGVYHLESYKFATLTKEILRSSAAE